MKPPDRDEPLDAHGTARRRFLRNVAAGAATLATAPVPAAAFDFASFFQKHFREMDPREIEEMTDRLARKYEKKYGRPFTVEATGPVDGVLFGYGLDVNRCIGCRRCVYACAEENNLSRDPEIQWIRVLEFERERTIRDFDLEQGDPYYDHETVPAKDKVYLPISCQQCEDSPCTKVCPTGATWEEPDGIIVIDYDWCIGCRYCMAACPYGARRFNWGEPSIPAEDLNPNVHVLGNRPRGRGVVEKCTFCIQRVRNGRYPACLEACPVGARKFGNLLDPESEIRYLLAHKRTFVLKAELRTRPKFFYFWG